MAYSTEVYKKVSEKFKQKKKDNEKDYQARIANVYMQFPAIKELDVKIRNVYLDYCEKATFANKNDISLLIQTHKAQSLGLQEEKKKLLTAAGLPQNYTDYKYDCDKCMDEGYIGSKMCSCFENELKKEQFLLSNIADEKNEHSFDKFNLDFYSNAVVEGIGASEKTIAQITLNHCKKYALEFNENSSNLIFMGKSGVGKTYLSCAIAKAVIQKGYSVIYDSAFNLFKKFEKEHFDKEINDTQIYMDCDLLIVDDLGAEFKTSYTEAVLFNIINTRLINKKPTIFSTNLKQNEIVERYSERIYSRIMGEYLQLCLFATDIRKQKKEKI